MPAKPWKDWTDDELADAAQQGLHGQGAPVEAMRRLRTTIETFSDSSAIDIPGGCSGLQSFCFSSHWYRRLASFQSSRNGFELIAGRASPRVDVEGVEG